MSGAPGATGSEGDGHTANAGRRSSPGPPGSAGSPGTDEPGGGPAVARRPSLAHRFQHAALSGLVRAVGGLPPRGRDAFVGALARLAYRGLRVRRSVVEANLRAAFPQADDAWIGSTAQACYAHLGREMLAAASMGRLSPEDIRSRTRVSGLDALRAALAEGRGAVLFTGHLGSWEMAGAALAVRGIPLDVVAQRQRNPLVDALITDARERTGMRVIERSRAPRQGLRALRQGRAVGFVADQDARRSGVFVPYFGRPASTHRGPAILALRARAPLFMVQAVRVGEGYDVTVEPVEVDREGDVDDVVRRMTAAVTARLEQAVRRHPGQYLWLHKRWKTRP